MAARHYLVGAALGAAMVAGVFYWQPLHTSTPIDHDITFSDYNFYDSKDSDPNVGTVQINGSLDTVEPNDPERPTNNTYTIQCLREEMKCRLASAEQIGDQQIDEISLADFRVTEWRSSEIIATDYEDGDLISCAKNILTIDRLTQKTYYVSTPVNSERPVCAKASTKIIKYTIGDSRVWAYLKKSSH